MKRFLASLSFVVACANGPGQPWGQADMSLAVAPFSLSPERTTVDGRLRTAKSYGLVLERFDLEFKSFALLMASPEGDVSFDPANPPPPYTFCHNHDCHTADGRIATFEEIELELRRAGEGGGASIVRAIDVEGSLLASEPVQVPLQACPESCDLPRGKISGADFAVSRIVFELLAFDDSAGGRLPQEGRRFRASWPVDLRRGVPLEVVVDRGHKVGIRVAGEIRFPERVFDVVDWNAYGTLPDEDLSSQNELAGYVAKHLSGVGDLGVQVTRYDP